MTSDNMEGNTMVKNSKDYLIQPFSDDKQNPNSLSLALSIISSYIHISLHTHTHTFVFNVWLDAELWITQCQNKETRSTPFKEENLPKNPIKLGGLLSPREDHTRSLPFESNSFYESNLFPSDDPFDQIQSTFPH